MGDESMEPMEEVPLIPGTFFVPAGSSLPKWHLDHFERFAGLTRLRNKHTDTQTTLLHDVCSSSPHLALLAMRAKTRAGKSSFFLKKRTLKSGKVPNLGVFEFSHFSQKTVVFKLV